LPENGDRPDGGDRPPEEVPSLSLEDLVDEPLGPDCLAGLPADRYTPVARLGEGTFGEVIRAHDGALDRDVAVKRIRLEAFSAPGELEEVKQRFVREARVAAQLRHPNVVTTHDIVSTPRSSLIVMELVEGRDLETLLRERGRLGLDETLDLLGQVASALDHAHDSGVIHRDIKPANIMVEPSGRVKVMDFGIAKVERGGHLTSTGLIMGTPHYMSPEQARGEKVDARADVFSLGCVLYECLSGTRPFEADAVTGILLKVVTEPPPPVDFEALGLPRALDAVLRRALAKEAGSRFGSAGDLLEATRQAARGIEPPPPPVAASGTLVAAPPPAVSGADPRPGPGPTSSAPRPGPASHAGKRRPGPLAALAAALVVAATVGGVALRALQPSAPPPPAEGDSLVVEEVPGFFGRLLGREARLHITVPGKTALSLQMTTNVGSATTRPGEAITAELVEAVDIEGHEAMGQGARVGGRVAQVEPAAEAGGRGRLVLEFDVVVLADGTRVPIESEPVEMLAPPPRPAKSRKTGLAGAWAKVTSTVGDIVRDVKGEDSPGGIAGARAVQGGGGMDLELPAGSSLDVALTEPVTVTRLRDR
jgi:tRNA A-37 threonylcarbamoyl transferase component Bud32